MVDLHLATAAHRGGRTLGAEMQYVGCVGR